MTPILGIVASQITGKLIQYLAVAHGGSPYITIYPWSAGFGTKYADPAVLPTGTGYGVRFTSDKKTVAVAIEVSPFITAYAFDKGFGTKYANPATLPTNVAIAVAFTPADNAVAVAHVDSPYITAYPWSAGFGTKYAKEFFIGCYWDYLCNYTCRDFYGLL